MSPGTKSNFDFGTPAEGVQQYDCKAGDYESLLKLLPEDVNPIKNWSFDGDGIPSADDVSSWFPRNESVAFRGPENSISSPKPMSYSALHEEIGNFIAYDTAAAENDGTATMVVGLVLPHDHMAEAAVMLVSLLAQHSKTSAISVAPIDPNMPRPKLVATLEHLQCTALITTQGIYDQIQDDAVLHDLCDIRLIQPDKSHNIIGAVKWTYLKQEPLRRATFAFQPDQQPALLLRTSGTTSTPKIVPLTAASLLYNATSLAVSIALKPDDVGCNAMPLFHIGGISCALLTVLVSGSSIVMMQGSFNGQSLLDAIVSKEENEQKPTWYYGVPSMHKTLIMTAKARAGDSGSLPNRLRFIRSGAAHLPHETAVELAELFQTKVIPTYSMSECMPVCSCHDAPIESDKPRDAGIPENTVGFPIGSSMAILDEEGESLPYGDIGEVALKGPGVIASYIGVSKEESHTPAGWFKTGDMGSLDRNGRLVLSGRQKEMIKRGGDQIWPNEVDSVVETVPGVRVAVTFGVPNDLWGEEVQVAVVLEGGNEGASLEMSKLIVRTCKDALGAAAAPSQVLYVDSTDRMPKTASGKYIRTKMAESLGAKAVDTGALQMMQNMAASAESSSKGTRATPSTALNGLRFLVACFVVQLHVGLMPNGAWTRIQNFSVNMEVFIVLGAFQLVCSMRASVKNGAYGSFVGNKIGAMQSMFILVQVIAFASMLLLYCGEGGISISWEGGSSCAPTVVPQIPISLINMLTGALSGTFAMLFGIYNISNGPTWFQTVFYCFLLIYPLLDRMLRLKSTGVHGTVLGISLGIGTFYWMILPEFFEYGIISWLPVLIAAMNAGYIFSRHASLDDPEHGAKGQGLLKSPRAWGVITDSISVFFLFLVVLTGRQNDSCLQEDVAMAMRPGEEFSECFSGYWVTDIGYDEYLEFAYEENFGRWFVTISGIFGARLGLPLVLLWIFAMAYGRGLTARIMNTQVMQKLSHYAYPLYLLHMPITIIWWMITRGHQAELWWLTPGGFVAPVNWYELPIIIAICLLLSAFLERYVIAYMSPYTIRFYTWAFNKFFCCEKAETASSEDESTLQRVERLVQGLTGIDEVTASTNLTDLGMDSLGATALLGTLHASVPEARKVLTLAKLAKCETVGDLIEVLEGDMDNKDEGDNDITKDEGDNENIV